jgi:hypothetical protein
MQIELERKNIGLQKQNGREGIRVLTAHPTTNRKRTEELELGRQSRKEKANQKPGKRKGTRRQKQEQRIRKKRENQKKEPGPKL